MEKKLTILVVFGLLMLGADLAEMVLTYVGVFFTSTALLGLLTIASLPEAGKAKAWKRLDRAFKRLRGGASNLKSKAVRKKISALLLEIKCTIFTQRFVNLAGEGRESTEHVVLGEPSHSHFPESEGQPDDKWFFLGTCVIVVNPGGYSPLKIEWDIWWRHTKARCSKRAFVCGEGTTYAVGASQREVYSLFLDDPSLNEAHEVVGDQLVKVAASAKRRIEELQESGHLA